CQLHRREIAGWDGSQATAADAAARPPCPGTPSVLRQVHARGEGIVQISDLDLKIWRGDARAGELVSYRVPVREGMVVLDAVLWVQANLASDLAVRWNCKAAKCGSCSAEIDGFPRLMCKTSIAEYGASVTVRPMKAFPLIKDLVTDVSWNYEVNKKIPPFTPSEKDRTTSEPWRMQRKDVERVLEFRKCIECF